VSPPIRDLDNFDYYDLNDDTHPGNKQVNNIARGVCYVACVIDSVATSAFWLMAGVNMVFWLNIDICIFRLSENAIFIH
jgi:hypothetical protein